MNRSFGGIWLAGLAWAGAVLLAAQAPAEVRLPAIFSSNMVLQRQQPLSIWGQADPGERVTVQFAQQTRTTSADQSGHWRVQLDPLPASNEPATLVVQASNRISLDNVLVGEVWLCSGQSNMDWVLANTDNGQAAIAAADHPHIRLFFVPRKIRSPGGDIDSSWQVCTPETIKPFSAVGYYFGRELHQSLKVPIGLINSSWGGTQAEAWTPEAYLLANEQLRACVERSQQWQQQRPRVQAEFDAAIAQWQQQVQQARAQGRPEPPRPREPDAIRPQRIAASLWISMLQPIVPFTIRGAVWYQGESNEARAQQYKILLPTMIRAWRDAWGYDFPFGIVQLPNYRAPSTQPDDTPWSHLRDAQLYTFKTVPNTGLIVTIDIGEANNIHPKNKLDVGRRLARWALESVYHQDAGGKSGPIYASSRIEGNRVIIKFDEVGSGLAVRDGDAQLQEFAIAGEDRQWHWATARIISKDEVEVYSDQVPNPKAVRYAWNSNPKNPNLTNSSGLPASPFRTDDWPGPTDGKR
ncbi:sialate O-acetylesterase [Fontivita pretiosa]|uniref:sialate O-acetylesterase n=1 Tax=Fontivita pretiosa TaxID=2989684 RepID=UPI003D17B44B